MKLTFAAVAVAMALSGPAAAQHIVFTSWGGTTQDAQMKNWAKPFTAKSGINVVPDGPTDYGKLQAMVEANATNWDVVDVEADFARQAGAKGLLEPLDFNIIDKSKLDPRFVSKYSVGSFYYSFVLGYSKTAYPNGGPKTLADLFNTKKFPGKRGFYKWSAPGLIEAALLADGVPADKLYPLDLDRAFKKLDTIKKDIVWWSTGAQSQQLLASGEAPIGFFWNGRLAALQATGVPVGISWDQNITEADSLVVPKGTKNKEAAMKFIAEATSAQAQANFAAETGYGPINLGSPALMDAKVRANLPSEHAAGHIDANLAYWAAHRDEIAKRWYAWQAR